MDTAKPHTAPLAFTLVGIDRGAQYRAKDAQIREFLTGGKARFLPVWNQKHLIDEDNNAPRPRFLSHADATAVMDLDETPPVFLGFMDDAPWFALGLADSEEAPSFGPSEFRILNDVATRLPAEEATLLAYARAMVIWHYNHRHCGRCGSAAAVTEGGHSRTCTNAACGHRSFPRIDPAVITVVVHPDGQHCLMGRQPRWPAGMYSIIAGFVEPGETLEGAVIRETKEETGVEVTDVRYIASQPWPFPTSIMLGFRAQALTAEIRPDDEELEDCKWFSRDDLRAMYAAIKVPNTFSISRWLIDQWMNEG